MINNRILDEEIRYTGLGEYRFEARFESIIESQKKFQIDPEYFHRERRKRYSNKFNSDYYANLDYFGRPNPRRSDDEPYRYQFNTQISLSVKFARNDSSYVLSRGGIERFDERLYKMFEDQETTVAGENENER